MSYPMNGEWVPGWNVALVLSGTNDVINRAFISSPVGDVEALPKSNHDGSAITLPNSIPRTLPACDIALPNPPASTLVSSPGVFVLEDKTIFIAGGMDASDSPTSR